MRKWKRKSGALMCGVWLGCAGASYGQALPPPVAPQEVAPKAVSMTAGPLLPPAPAAAQKQAPPNSSGLLRAEHVFEGKRSGAVAPVSHEYPASHECQVCPPGTPVYAPSYSPQTDCECRDEHTCGLFCGLLHCDGDRWDLSDLFWESRCMESTIDFGGWVQAGYHNKSDGLFNTHPDHFDVHQLNFYIESIADGSEGFDVGFRFDAMYGTDAQNTQAFGNTLGRWDYANGFDHGVYGWALPQLYAEFAYYDTSVKVGKFYTPVGYEVVTSPGNFFYSHALTMNFSEPFTHTGALATYEGIEDITVYGGYTLGWDTGFDSVRGGGNFLGGVSLSLLDNLTFTYMATAGNLGRIGDGYSHSLVLDYLIDEDWEYVVQSDLTAIDAAFADHDSVGVNQYLFYNISECVRAGGRFEWWKYNGTSFYEATLGLNILPTPNLTIRPEIRHQWSPAGDVAANNPLGIPVDDSIFGVDVILTF